MTENKSYYITTPIYYVNDSPHLGHAYTTIACDIMARFKRLDGYDVKFLTGTDEHGQKVDKAASLAEIDPQDFVDDVSKRFRNLVKTGDNILNVTNDDFIRTTESRHKKAAQALWKKLEKNGHIYLDKYEGWYSVRDEAFYQESELIDGKAPTGAEVEWTEEQSYFFKLSAFEDKLLEFYKENHDFIIPESRYNEVVSFVKGGLRDLSISRTSFNWGVDVPNSPSPESDSATSSPESLIIGRSSADGKDSSRLSEVSSGNEASHIMYVWIDALTNYLTSIGFPDESSEEYQKYWCNAENSPVHIVGKDILRFHAVYWPAFLMAADIPLPKKIVAHGWWTIEGEKMSKSVGNVLSPYDLIENAGGTDQLRYFLMRAMPFGNDGDFSQNRMVELINADLANNIGNLAQRSLSMIFKNCDGKIPNVADSDFTEDDLKLMHQMRSLNLRKKMDNFDYSGALEKIMHFAGKANEYIDNQAPWKLRKENPERMKVVLYTLAEVIRCLAIHIQPFTPIAANKILDQLSVSKNQRDFKSLSEEFKLNEIEIEKPDGVFPRLEVAQVV